MELYSSSQEPVFAPVYPAPAQPADLRQKRGRRVLALILTVTVLVPSCFVLLLLAVGYSYGRLPFMQPPQMAAVEFASRDAVGNLGGVPVSIPRRYAGYMEYDGDPGFAERRKGPIPPRTTESAIRSFGFDVPFPSMEALSFTDSLRAERFNAQGTDTWIMVGIISGGWYSGAQLMPNLYKFKILRRDWHSGAPYVADSEKSAGLQVFKIAGRDEITGKPHREDQYARDIFVHRNAVNELDTFISCSNLVEPRARCKHIFTLEPLLHAQVTMHYQRSMLPHWQAMQLSISKRIHSFTAANNSQPMITGDKK